MYKIVFNPACGMWEIRILALMGLWSRKVQELAPNQGLEKGERWQPARFSDYLEAKGFVSTKGIDKVYHDATHQMPWENPNVWNPIEGFAAARVSQLRSERASGLARG